MESSRFLPRLCFFFFCFFFEGSHIEIDIRFTRFTSRGRKPFEVRQVSRERASDTEQLIAEKERTVNEDSRQKYRIFIFNFYFLFIFLTLFCFFVSIGCSNEKIDQIRDSDCRGLDQIS